MATTALLILIVLAALIYASVGHGGASGYLAAMALLAYAPAAMASSALLLNLLVAGIACLMFWRAGHGSFRLLWPFIVGSAPAALLGGWLPVSARTYAWLLAAVLLVAAVRLCWPTPQYAALWTRPRLSVAVLVGAGIGLLSGMVGVGGGIFLSPLMMLLRWADAKQTAAVSAGFIVVNSITALMGRIVAGRLVIGSLAPLVVAACAGGVMGARWGARHVSGAGLRRLLAVVLVIAAGKLVLRHG